jgi:predicted PurR-regulated permease PerM
MAAGSSRNTFGQLTLMASFVLVVAAMYWARAVLIPVALAILLAFLLSPLVRALQQRGVKRIPSVLLVVVAAFIVLGGVVWILTAELTDLAREYTRPGGYHAKLETKIQDLRESLKGTVLERFLQPGRKPDGPPEDRGPGGKDAAERVILVTEQSDVLRQLTGALDPVVHFLGSTGLIVLLVILMLIHREELRNRLIRLAGYGRLTVTTRALDEASSRISYYLMMKSLFNSGVGIVIGLGLLAIGIDYAFLWGFLVAVLRFIPSLGTWLAMLAPLGLSLVGFEWWQTLSVLGLFVVVELFTGNVLEPLTYGHRIGVSSVALVVALAFWTWLWGPVGLVLATPLTVCLAVLGKYFPQLEFINVLMSDQPALESDIRYYQRLLARDQDEATDVVEKYLGDRQAETGGFAEEVYDELLLPALTSARAAREREELAEEDLRFVLGATRELLEDVTAPPAPPAGEAPTAAVRALGYAPRDEVAVLALEMVGQMLQRRGCGLELAPVGMLLSELAARVEEERPAALCVASLAPGGLAAARSLLKRLRGRFPELKVVVARLGAAPEDVEKDRKVLVAAGADVVAATLREARDHVAQLLNLPPFGDKVTR